MIDIVVPSDSNIKKKEYEKLEKYQGLKEEVERTWKVKAKVVPVVTGALGAVTHKMEEWLQQIAGTTSDLSVQKSAVLVQHLRYCTEPSNSQPCGRGPKVEEDTHTTHCGEKLIFFNTYIYIYFFQLLQFKKR